MKRILLLNDKQFPGLYASMNVTPPAGVTKAAYMEERILAAINAYYRNLNVTGIEYLAIESQFSHFKAGKSNGAIVEEFDIDPSLEKVYKDNGCHVDTTGNVCRCRRLMLYVFVSETVEKVRNAFVSQTVFPELLDYAEDYLDSPSYTIANHKFCFISILNKTITSPMILRHLASLCAAGMDFVEAFGNGSIIPSEIPKDLKRFLQLYSSGFPGKYDAAANTYEDEHYRIDFHAKVFTWKTAAMIARLVSKPTGTVDFNGSNEKFYWIETMPMALFAYNQGYKVDYAEFAAFIAKYRPLFSKASDKFARCEVLLQYAQKYFDA